MPAGGDARARDSADGFRALPPWVVRWSGFSLCALLVGAVVWVLVHMAAAVPVVVFAVVAAVLFTSLLEPFHAWLVRRRLPPAVAALLSMTALVAVVGGGLVFVIRRAVDQLSQLGDAAEKAATDLQELLSEPPLSIPPDRVTTVTQDALERLRAVGQDNAWSATATVTEVVSGIVLALVLGFFFLKDGTAMWEWGRAWLPERRRDRADRAVRAGWASITGYARGVVVIAAADAAGVGIGLFVLGVPLAASLTLLVFLGAFIPIVGTFVAGALAVLVTAATVGLWQGAVVLALVIVVQQLEGNVLQPLIMSRAVDLHPVVVILSVTTGAILAGVGGAAIAVPLVAVAYQVALVLREPAGNSTQPSRAVTSGEE